MSLKKQALSGIFWTSLQRFSTQGISFVMSIILARLLLPEEFGLIAMIGVFLNVGTALISSGLSQSLIRTDNPDEEDFSTVFFFNLAGSIIIYLLLFFAAPLIAAFYKQDILSMIIRLYCLTFIINAFAAIQTTRLTKIMDFKTQMKVAVPSLLIGSIVGVGMAWLGYGVWSLVWMNIAQSVASTIQLWFWAKWKPRVVFNVEKFKYHFNYGYKTTLAGLLNTVFADIYTIIIGRFFSPVQVGFYNRADTLKQFPVNNIGVILDKVTFPLFAAIKNDDVKLKSVYKRILQLVIFLVAPTLILMAVLAEPLFRFLLTEKWLPAVPYFQILCFNGILYPVHSYNLNILKVKGRSDLFLKLEIIKKFLIVAMVLISFQFGIFGLLYGSVISSVIAFFINTYYTGKFLNYTSWEQSKDIVPIIFLALLAGAGVYAVDYMMRAMHFVDLLRLIIGSTSGLVLFICLAWLLKMKPLFELKTIILRK